MLRNLPFHRFACCFVAFSLVASAFTGLSVKADDTKEPLADGPVKRYIELQKKYRSIVSRTEVEFWAKENGKKTTACAIGTIVRRNGDQISVTSAFTYSTLKGRRDFRKLRTHEVIDGDKAYSFRTPLTNGKPVPAMGDVTFARLASYAGYPVGSALDGYFVGSDGKSLADLLQLPTTKIHIGGRVSIQGEPCREVTATTPYGEIKLCLAEKLDSIPLQVVYTKGGLDRWDGSTSLSASKYSKKMPNVASWSANLTDVVVSKINDTYVASGGRLVMRWQLVDDTNIVESAHYLRSKLRPGYDFSNLPNAFAFGLPEGTEMRNRVDGIDGTQYVWRKGKVVAGMPDFGPGAPKRKNRWLAQLGSLTTWMLDFGLISFNVGAAVVLVRMQTGRWTKSKGPSA
jgi:hypothetical protein